MTTRCDQCGALPAVGSLVFTQRTAAKYGIDVTVGGDDLGSVNVCGDCITSIGQAIQRSILRQSTAEEKTP